jgi:hypothetical protein
MGETGDSRIIMKTIKFILATITVLLLVTACSLDKGIEGKQHSDILQEMILVTPIVATLESPTKKQVENAPEFLFLEPVEGSPGTFHARTTGTIADGIVSPDKQVYESEWADKIEVVMGALDYAAAMVVGCESDCDDEIEMYVKAKKAVEALQQEIFDSYDIANE